MLENYQENTTIEFDSVFLYKTDKYHCKCIVNYHSKTTDFTIFSDSGLHKIGGILPFICTDFKERQSFIIKCIDSHFNLMEFGKKIPLSSNEPLLPF